MKYKKIVIIMIIIAIVISIPLAGIALVLDYIRSYSFRYFENTNTKLEKLFVVKYNARTGDLNKRVVIYPNFTFLSISPDDRYLLYYSNESEPEGHNVYLIDLKKKSIEFLTQISANTAGWISNNEILLGNRVQGQGTVHGTVFNAEDASTKIEMNVNISDLVNVTPETNTYLTGSYAGGKVPLESRLPLKTKFYSKSEDRYFIITEWANCWAYGCGYHYYRFDFFNQKGESIGVFSIPRSDKNNPIITEDGYASWGGSTIIGRTWTSEGDLIFAKAHFDRSAGKGQHIVEINKILLNK